MTTQTARTIDIRLRELTQLFNSLDPSPFREKDLDANAEEFIVATAMETDRRQPLALVVHLEKPPQEGMDVAKQLVADAVRHYFDYLATQQRRKLRELMRFGRNTLLIAVAFLAACILASRLVAAMSQSPFMAVLQESLFIVGWVAMWRPLEIVLYEWWPIVRLRRLYQRMSEMGTDVRVRGVG